MYTQEQQKCQSQTKSGVKTFIKSRDFNQSQQIVKMIVRKNTQNKNITEIREIQHVVVYMRWLKVSKSSCVSMNSILIRLFQLL